MIRPPYKVGSGGEQGRAVVLWRYRGEAAKWIIDKEGEEHIGHAFPLGHISREGHLFTWMVLQTQGGGRGTHFWLNASLEKEKVERVKTRERSPVSAKDEAKGFL